MQLRKWDGDGAVHCQKCHIGRRKYCISRHVRRCVLRHGIAFPRQSQLRYVVDGIHRIVHDEARLPLDTTASWGANSQDDLADFSSLGPTEDGRFKPDLVADGQRVISSGNETCGEGADLRIDQGTSMSTPVVAASLVLARQYFLKG